MGPAATGRRRLPAASVTPMPLPPSPTSTWSLLVGANALLGLPGGASGHGAVTLPPPRNALDADLWPWNQTVPSPIPFGEGASRADFWCASPSASAAGGASSLNLTGQSGQACYWFSNGCQTGCKLCDGNTRGPVPKFIYPGGLPPAGWDVWAAPGLIPDPEYIQPSIHNGNATGRISPGGSGQSICPATPGGPGPVKATICDPRLRTVNINAPCGTDADYYYYSPCLIDCSSTAIQPTAHQESAGHCGGRRPGQGNGGAGAAYANTSGAQLADLGSALPPRPSGTVWAPGSTVEVAFTTSAFHGGGYSYRICPLDMGVVDEECFQAHPLDFVGQSSLRWGGVGGERLYFNATLVNEGTMPPGSMWAKHPVPRGPWGWGRTGASHPPICQESEECLSLGIRGDKEACRKAPHSPGCKPIPRATANATKGCRCSDDGAPSGPANLEIVDQLWIPSDLSEGKWLLGWRWDAEESSQVWASCSDVTIKKAVSTSS